MDVKPVSPKTPAPVPIPSPAPARNKFRVRWEDGYVWVDPQSLKSRPDVEFVYDDDPAFAGQKHKLAPASDPVNLKHKNRAMPPEMVEARAKAAKAAERLQE